MTTTLRLRRLCSATLAGLVGAGLIASPATAAPAERYIVSMSPAVSLRIERCRPCSSAGRPAPSSRRTGWTFH